MIDWFVYSLSCAFFQEMLLWSWLRSCSHSLDAVPGGPGGLFAHTLFRTGLSYGMKGIFLVSLTADGKHVRDFLLGDLSLGVLLEGYGSNLFTGLEILIGVTIQQHATIYHSTTLSLFYLITLSLNNSITLLLNNFINQQLYHSFTW